jgi:hypothetical protein
MKPLPATPPDKSIAPGFRSGPICLLCIVGLAAWQAWMTFSLFGPDKRWERLFNDQEVLSGQHPLHLYHGYLGAEAIWTRGRICCYDPAFQAGYPKTPVFDSSCRLAEMFLLLAGGTYQPAVYKLGLAACYVSVPFFLMVAARGMGLGRPAACVATAAGLLVCWGNPGRAALEEGQLDLLMGALAGLAQFGLLIRFHRDSGFGAWAGILLTGCLGWLASPVLFALLFPLVLLYYLTVGARHRSLAWHGALLVGLAGGMAVNAFWLIQWVKHWWIRSPLQLADALLPHRTIHTIWSAPLWGDAFDRSLELLLVGAAVVGIMLLNQSHQRAAARLLGFGVSGLLGLAILGIASEQLGQLGTAHLLVPGLWFATVPAAHALMKTLGLVSRLVPNPWHVMALGATLLLALGLTIPDALACLAGRGRGTTPLVIGLGPARAEVVETLTRVTTSKARILWEDFPEGNAGQHWTALFPLWTDRYFLGGLDPDAAIEHSYASFMDQNLAGRPVIHWSDAQLEEFCRRYNVGWIVCWSPAAKARIGTWKKADPIVHLGERKEGCVYAIRRPHTFALRGKAKLIHADCRHITLADVVPQEGKVVLSLHYQADLRASPSRALVEREPDPNDPIPFIRLNVSGPVARLTLTWEEP